MTFSKVDGALERLEIEARRQRVLARTRELAAAEASRPFQAGIRQDVIDEILGDFDKLHPPKPAIPRAPELLSVQVPAAAVAVANPADYGLSVADGGARGRGQRARLTGDVEHMQAYAHVLNLTLAQSWLIDTLPRPCVARQAVKRALAHVLKVLDKHNANA